MKSKEISSKLASYPAMKSLATHSTSCTGYYLCSVHTNLQDLIPTLALVFFVAYNYTSKVGIKSCRFV